jgi:uncharacterized Fe-S cluster protein YjdI/CDGSH-type Zn-finger protein
MPKRLQTYSTAEIQVTFDPGRCIHAAECIRGLPAVFDTSRARWIRPELAPAADVAAVVARCPTGALHYRLAEGDRERVDGVTVRVTRNGPMYVVGSVRLETEDGRLIVEDTRVALCRCGKSANQPFCDGTHRTQRFKDGAAQAARESTPRVGQSPT